MNEFINVSLEEFRHQISVLENFVTDPQWLWTLKYDILLNPNLGTDIEIFIKEVNLSNLKANELELTMQKIKDKSLIAMKKADQEKNRVQKWFLYRVAYSYYGFLETIIEGSILTSKIFTMIKEKYGDLYLDILAKVDNMNPSALTNFKKVKGDISGEEIDLYLLMKKWQDIEHLYHNNDLIKKHDQAKADFDKYVYDNCPYLKEISGRDLLGIYLLDCLSFISMEQLHKFFDIGIDDKLANIIGGKNLGLAKLSYHNVDIPKAVAIPVGSVINKRYKKDINSFSNHKYSVRSSATVEDNTNQSFAGLFITELDISCEKLCASIEKVYQSVFSNRVIKYCEKFNTKKPYMSVVIQEFKEPQYSGVWLGNSLDTGHLEWTNGNGEKLVSGKVIPKYENWNEKVINPLKIGDEIVAEKCISLQHELNTISDFEWCVVDGKLLFVQFRPVTVKFNVDSKNTKADKSISGIPASSGFVKGKPHYLEKVSVISKFKKGEILLADFTDPDWVPAMIESSAIVTAEGGFLSHSAIISRELGIPCITGIGYDKIELLSKQEKIVVDGTKGAINILN